MALSIATNMMAAGAARNLGTHCQGLSDSVRRLSSGLRVTTAADDAAGLAVRELMRADVTSLKQGMRNANDAISMIQTADGALQVIDEKLIRMKELAEQAATGTYNADQRQMIDREFQAMASEINRIAKATDFNGVKLLDGSRVGAHDGEGLEAAGDVKIHFGTGNDSAEDYYYARGADATITGLGLGDNSGGIGNISILSDKLDNGAPPKRFTSNIISFAVIPAGTKNLYVELNDYTQNDSIQVFSRNGAHLLGTSIGFQVGFGVGEWSDNGVTTVAGMNDKVITKDNGFFSNASYTADRLNGDGSMPTYTPGAAGNSFIINGMNFGYSGEGNLGGSGGHKEYMTIDEVTEDLILLVVGTGAFEIKTTWDEMPDSASGLGEELPPISISTQSKAQAALERVDEAILKKDAIRADLGALQNRLENTVTNLAVQAENLQASESRISDADAATEMTAFVRNQVLTQAAVAMLSQANSLPSMAMRLIER